MFIGNKYLVLISARKKTSASLRNVSEKDNRLEHSNYQATFYKQISAKIEHSSKRFL